MRVLFYLVCLLSIPISIRAERADYATAERFTPKEILRLLFGDTGLTAGQRRDDSFSVHFDPEIVRPHWIQGSARFWYVYMERGGGRVVIFDAARQIRVSRSLKDLAHFTGRMTDSLPDVRAVSAAGDIDFVYDGQYWHWNPNSVRADIVEVARSVLDEPVIAPDCRTRLGVRDHNLWMERPGEPPRELSHDGETWHGFGRDPGETDSQLPLELRLGWFRDGRRFWVERWDNRKVGRIRTIDAREQPRPSLKTMRYAFPGDAEIPSPELWIGDLDSEKLLRVDTARWPEGQFVGNMDIGVGTATGGITSAGTRDRLYFVRMSRGYREIELCLADPTTGSVRVLLHERGEPYFSIRSPVFRVLPDGGFVWLSDRTGWNHLYRYDASGHLLGAITEGEFNVAHVLQVDERDGWIYFSGFGREEGRHRHYDYTYRVRLDGSNCTLLTPEDAAHTTSVSPDGNYLVDVFSRSDLPPCAVLRTSSGKLVQKLEQTDVGPLVAAGWKPPQVFTAKAADGRTILYGGIWQPYHRWPGQKYPVIAMVMPNSGNSGNIPVRFDPADAAQSLAQLGFVVVRSCTRGQAQGVRSKMFLVYGYGNMRDYPLADSKAALIQAASTRPYMDLARAGVTGYSGGGFMSAALFLTYPDFYQVCVSGAGNHDNNIYEMNSSEFYYGNGLPGTRLAHTPFATNQELAHNLKGRLLLVHADTDQDVNFAHSLRLSDALIQAGKKFDFLVIPGRDHDLRDRQGYFERVRWNYFAEHLLGDRRMKTDLWRLDQEQ